MNSLLYLDLNFLATQQRKKKKEEKSDRGFSLLEKRRKRHHTVETKSFLEADLAELGGAVEPSELKPPDLQSEVAGAQAGLGNRSGMFCSHF